MSSPIVAEKNAGEIDPRQVAPPLRGAAIFFGTAGAVGVAMAVSASPHGETQQRARDISLGVGVGFLGWGVLAGAASLALTAFDPSTGEFRLPPLEAP